ncbi:MAG: energy transducer TonB [Thermoanaerobaculia bacterium]
MRSRLAAVILLLCPSVLLFGQDEELQKAPLPTGVILVKGAEPSTSDSVTPIPESGSVNRTIYQNDYFGLTYRLPADWVQQYPGPPPSDSANYVLAQLEPSSSFKGPDKGTIIITAQDLFFARSSAANAMEVIQYSRDKLPSYYDVERSPAELKIAGRSFARFDYRSEVAGLHWYVFATEVRCHAVQFIFSSRDAEMLERLVAELGNMKLKEPSSAPVCIPDYASDQNVVQKVDAVITEHRASPMPVRIIIDRKGRVKHVHVINAFREQGRAITDALMQWTFKPYMQNAKAVEVETGILFGSSRAEKLKADSASR